MEQAVGLLCALPSVRPPLGVLLQLLPRMALRPYTIASAPSVLREVRLFAVSQFPNARSSLRSLKCS